MDSGLNIASVCIHRGEEPVIGGKNGICNIFFAGCNLKCVYCQNHEISRPCSTETFENDLSSAVLKIESILAGGIKSVGFVSPSHMVPQMRIIIGSLQSDGFRPTIVYNTNSYDRPTTLRDLKDLIDVYLPDFKYVSPELSRRFSGASDYPDVALKALKEMYWQKGSSLIADEEGRAEAGMVIRHLVLPGYADESKKVLRTIADELSAGVHLSLMSQYHPVEQVSGHPELGRTLYREEYEEVVEEMNRLGFRNGWTQDLDSYLSYRPDFSREHPFET